MKIVSGWWVIGSFNFLYIFSIFQIMYDILLLWSIQVKLIFQQQGQTFNLELLIPRFEPCRQHIQYSNCESKHMTSMVRFLKFSDNSIGNLKLRNIFKVLLFEREISLTHTTWAGGGHATDLSKTSSGKKPVSSCLLWLNTFSSLQSTSILAQSVSSGISFRHQ